MFVGFWDSQLLVGGGEGANKELSVDSNDEVSGGRTTPRKGDDDR